MDWRAIATDLNFTPEKGYEWSHVIPKVKRKYFILKVRCGVLQCVRKALHDPMV